MGGGGNETLFLTVWLKADKVNHHCTVEQSLLTDGAAGAFFKLFGARLDGESWSLLMIN